MEEKKSSVNNGFGLRLWYSVLLFVLGVVAVVLVSVFLTDSDGGVSDDKLMLFLLGVILGPIAVGESITQLIVAFLGKRSKRANVLSIVLGAMFLPTVVGVMGIIGGVKGLNYVRQLEAEAPPYTEEEKKKKPGFKCRLAFALFWLIPLIIFLVIFPITLIGEEAHDVPTIIMYVGLPIFIPLVLFGVLCMIGAFVGKRKIWANRISLVIGWIFALGIIGILGILGGESGIRVLKREQDENRRLEEEAERQRLESQVLLKQSEVSEGQEQVGVDAPTDGEQTSPAEVQVFETKEYVQPKMSEKGKKGIMIALIACYSVLFLVGVLLASIPAMGSIFRSIGDGSAEAGRAYAMAIGLMWVALTPTLGYYFATISPIALSKKYRVIIAAATTALLVIMNVVFFVVTGNVKLDGERAVSSFYDGSDSWFVPVTMVFASVAIAVCYVLTQFKINPDKIATAKPVEPEGHELFAMVKYVFALIGYGVLKLVKALLVAKEKQPDVFVLVASVLLTWLAYFVSFVLSIIMIAVIVTVIVLAFTGLVRFCEYGEVRDTVVITVNGQSTELTCLSYVSENGEKVYEDKYGATYYSADGGKTVYRK